MKTITIQIGNSDDKLTQKEWHEFVEELRFILMTWYGYKNEIHFSGGSDMWAAWQNYCMVFTYSGERMDELRQSILDLKKQFRQDSIAWTEGETQFI